MKIFGNVKEMQYTTDNTPHVLAKGVYRNIEFFVLSMGTHPNVYLNVSKTKFDGMDYDNIPLSVHGGLTFSGTPTMCLYGHWIGWDYAHYGDYSPYSSVMADGKKWTTKELIADAILAIDELVDLLPKPDRKVIKKRLSSMVTKAIYLSDKVSVFDTDGKEVEKYLKKETRYVVSNPIVKITQTLTDFKQVQEMTYRLNQLRLNLKNAYKCYGLGWDDHKPAFILLDSKTNKAHAYWFDKKYDDMFMWEIFGKFEDAEKYLRNMYGETSVERWLTFNSSHSTNKKVLTVTDWIYRR